MGESRYADGRVRCSSPRRIYSICPSPRNFSRDIARRRLSCSIVICIRRHDISSALRHCQRFCGVRKETHTVELCLITRRWQRVKARMIAVTPRERSSRVIFMRAKWTAACQHRPWPNISPRFNIESVGNLSRNLFLGAPMPRENRREFKRHFRCKSGAPSRRVSPFFSPDREALSNLPPCAAAKFPRGVQLPRLLVSLLVLREKSS